MAFDAKRDDHLRAIDASHLFDASTTAAGHQARRLPAAATPTSSSRCSRRSSRARSWSARSRARKARATSYEG
jgi:hypothetical protein